MGLYGKIVQSPEYRDAKLRTVITMLPEAWSALARTLSTFDSPIRKALNMPAPAR